LSFFTCFRPDLLAVFKMIAIFLLKLALRPRTVYVRTKYAYVPQGPREPREPRGPLPRGNSALLRSALTRDLAIVYSSSHTTGITPQTAICIQDKYRSTRHPLPFFQRRRTRGMRSSCGSSDYEPERIYGVTSRSSRGHFTALKFQQ